MNLRRTRANTEIGQNRSSGLTWSPELVKLIRGKYKRFCSRLMDVLASGLPVTWTKSSQSKSGKTRPEPLSSSFLLLC